MIERAGPWARQQLRVLMIVTAREIGGAEIYAERLVKDLSPECRFTVALADDPRMADLAANLSRCAQVVTFPFDNTLRLLSITRELQRLARQCDVVHLNSNHPASRLGVWFAATMGGRATPVVCVEHRVTPVADVVVPRTVAWAMPALFRWSRRGVERVIAVSRENARQLVELYHLPPAQVRVVLNGADLDGYFTDAPAGSTLREELHLSADQPVILVLARLTANKGHRFLLQAAPAVRERFPDAHLVLAGSPDEREPIDALIEQLDLASHVAILGLRSDVPNLLRGSDVLVLPSLAEGFSLAIPEAMAAGLPVVATSVGGAPEIIVDGENGFLVPPEDAGALAQAIIRVLSLDPAGRDHLKHAAVETAKRFSSRETAQQMVEVYKSVIRTPGQA